MNKIKNIIYMIITFISLFVFSNDVKAVTMTEPIRICEYGVRNGDDGSTWDSRIKIEVYSRTFLRIDGAASYIVKSILFQDGGLAGGKAFYNTDGTKDYVAYGEDVSTVKSGYYYYISLWPFDSTYQSLEGKCPPTLRYELWAEGGGWTRYHLFFFNDDLDKPVTIKDFWSNILVDAEHNDDAWLSKLTKAIDLDKKGRLIEKESKDKPLSEIADDYGCPTYTAGLNQIKSSMNKVSPASCNNNAYFNKAYQDLNEMCNRYKSSSYYADEDSDELQTKACSKACTLFRDNVAKICGYDVNQPSCGSLGSRTIDWIFKIIRIVRYAVPALLVILSIIDYIKAIASDSDDEVKKTNGRVIKRMIAAALVFLVPFLLEFILNLFEIPGLNSNNPFCAN